MKKQMSSKLGVFIILVCVVAIGVGVFLLNSDNTKEYVVEETEEEMVAGVRNVVKEFMEEAYIRENYKKASSLYIPPEGFERFLSTEPISLEEYIEWYVRSVGLSSGDKVTSVQVIDVEKISDQNQIQENSDKGGLFKATFHFIKENGEPVYFGPCCGDDHPPSPDMFSYVKKTEKGYKIFEDLPYRP